MTTISVVQYHQSSPQKLNVLQQQNSQNVQSNRDILLVRKQSTILAADQKSLLNPKDILLTNPARKKCKPGEKLTNPAPVAVARRNARERNRVKQVNNGFATLRQHIPNSIAAAFESSNGRGGSKKLSKVETLRMAVEYIRKLEDMLSGEDTDQHSYTENSENISTSSSSNSFNSLSSTLSTPSSSPMNTNMTTANMQNIYNLHNATASPPHDNFTSSKTYQISLNTFYDDENLEPLDDNILSDPSLIDADIDLNQDLSLLNSMHTTGSLSPEMYSDNSLSPIAIDRCLRDTQQQMFIPVFNSTNEDIKLRITPEMIVEIKSEPLEEEDSKENMIQAMQWWETQQQQQQQSRSSNIYLPLRKIDPDRN